MSPVSSAHSGGLITGCSTGLLPAGLTVSLNAGECRILGTPGALSSSANYIIVASNAAGSTSGTVLITVNDIPPLTPSGLAAMGATQSVNLSWTPIAEATGYRVYRSTSSPVNTGNPVACNVVNGATASCIDSSLADGTSYYYAILATNSGGNSVLSASVSSVTLPAAPAGLTVTPGDSQNLISWSAVGGASSYSVFGGPSGGPYTTPITCASSTATSCTQGGLTNGTPYNYVVQANNASGSGLPSNSGSGTPSAAGSGTPLLPTVGAATNLAFVSSPTGLSYISQSVFKPSLTVAVRDASGITVTTSTATVTIYLSTNTASGTLAGTLIKNAVNGIATFDDISLNKAATTYQMRASASGLTTTPTMLPFTINGGAATQLMLTVASAKPGVCAGPFSIQALDASGNNAQNNSSGSPWTLGLSKSAGSASFYAATDSACSGSAVISTTIASGSNTGSFYLKDAATETFSVTVDGSSANLGSQSASVTVALLKYAYTANQSPNTISMLTMTPSTGTLVPNTPSSLAVAYTPSALTVDPLGRFVYVSSGAAIYTYLIDASGLLSAAATPSVATGTATSAVTTIDSTGKYFYAADYGGPAIRMFNINQTTGALTPMATPTLTYVGSPTQVIIDSGFKNLYVSDYASRIYMWRINASTGALTANTPSSIQVGATFDFNRPNGLVLDGSGHAFMADVTGDRVFQFVINALTGVLSPNATPTFALPSGTAPYAITADGTGNYIYTANRGSGSITMLKVISANGTLSNVAAGASSVSCGSQTTSIATDGLGKYIYAGNWTSSDICMYSVDSATGLLTAIAPGTVSTGSPQAIGLTK